MRTNQKTSQRNRETKTEVKHMNGRKVDNPYPLIFIKAEGCHTKTTKLPISYIFRLRNTTVNIILYKITMTGNIYIV